jgi:hypothetical protein
VFDSLKMTFQRPFRRGEEALIALQNDESWLSNGCRKLGTQLPIRADRSLCDLSAEIRMPGGLDKLSR